MHISKFHGLGNDFLLHLDHGSVGPVAAEQVKALCERRTGVGADGLIRSCRVSPGVITFELVNADGGAAEMSGNGARCLGLAAARAGWWDDVSQPLALQTPVGQRVLDWHGGDHRQAWLSVTMGQVEALGRPPERGDGDATTIRRLVSVGNPHLVSLIDGPMPTLADLEAKLPATDPGGSGDINYEFVVRGPKAGTLTMVVRERGAGWTQACGTGSVAAAWVALQSGWVGQRVTVQNPGGPVQVDLSGTEARLIGPAVFIADIEVPS